jgi:hypothetical protein
MKTIKYLSLMLLAVIAFVTSCKDDRELVPDWESGINGEGTITSAAKDFKRGDPSIPLDFNLKWISVDGKATVTKIDVFVLFKENYIDSNGDPAVANHGGNSGRLFTSFEGGEVPPNRTPVSFSITQPELYNLYQDATFDYGDGKGPVSVFGDPYNPTRDDVNRFVPEDKLTVIWHFTASDGRVFKAWSPSVCTEFPGSNCSVDFSVVCAEEIENPGANGGVYEISMTDTYGDGWNGAAIRVIIDGTPTDYTLLVGSSGVTNVTVPESATTLTFEFVSGDWDSEVLFSIKSPKGNVIASGGPSPAPGKIKLNLCNE